jgi:hypothetical protein
MTEIVAREVRLWGVPLVNGKDEQPVNGKEQEATAWRAGCINHQGGNMTICLTGELEERVLNLAAARNVDVEDQVMELIKYSLPLEETYEAEKQQERAPEQVWTMNVGLFPLGRIVITPAALEAFERSHQLPVKFLARHITGDYGLMSEWW